ncbi:MAG: hypothetical protein APR63_05980 [Desulfuromonas sp. SDB]|nr:MAG: hypothetical protein APR63_05980 [Desulfuromonas sp. SDB]
MWDSVYSFLFLIFWFAATVFWFWMLYQCIRYDPDRWVWIWLLIVLGHFGALLYFFIRKPLSLNIKLPSAMRKWFKKNEIELALEDAKNIGNPYQYVKLGELYLEVNETEKANQAFEQALQKDPSDLSALWGMATLSLRNSDFRSAQNYLTKIVNQDPQFNYGEASLSLARSYYHQQLFTQAEQQLNNHLEKWNHPEARVLLAEILINRNKTEQAVRQLNKVIADIKTAPKFYKKKHYQWLSRSKQRLNDIGNI